MSAKPKLTLKRNTVTEVAIGALTPDPNQPRKAFDEKSLQGLAASISERGILQPILVRQDGNRIVIVDGERRWRAAKLAKLKVVSVLLADLDEENAQQLLVDQVSVNQLREALKPMELARVLRTMRDSGKTVNDIAAMLAKQGHGAMKPAQITATAALVDLPTWAHEMIDGDQAEAAGLGKLLPILSEKGVEKPLRKRLEQFVGYRGKVVASEVVRAGREALEDTFAELDRIQRWDSNPVLFAWKTRCKGCEHLLQFEGFGYCRNAKLFKEHQAEAKAEGLLPGGKRLEKPKAVTAKAAEKAEESKREVREFSLTEKARDYLHAYLVRQLQPAVASLPDAARWLVAWEVLDRPGTQGHRGPPGVFFADEPGTSAAATRGVHGIEQILDPSADVQSFMETAAQQILCSMPWRETQLVARQFWGTDLTVAWKLDAAFLDLFRKAELVHLAVKHECNPGDGRLWDRMKGDDIKAALLTQPERLSRPAILVDLYEGEIDEPYKRWSPDDDNDDGSDDDISNDEDSE